MKIEPVASNHIKITLDNGDIWDINDGTPWRGLHLSPLNSKGKIYLAADDYANIIIQSLEQEKER